jgi:hypothetical protein
MRLGSRTRALVALVLAVAVVLPAPAVLAPAGSETTAAGAARAAPAASGNGVDTAATAEALRAVRADAVHARGLTGSGVDVGVIGSGFDDNRVVAPHVVDGRTFGDGTTAATAHDTAVAEVVSETAPAADLYLAGVGRTPTPTSYADAVDWLVERDVDIIVDSGSYFPSVAGDGRQIAAAADRATDEGVVFITSAGNYANRHWMGTGTAGGWVSFDDGDQANALADGARTGGRVTVRLRWQSTADYDLYLYRRVPGAADRVVAKSTRRDGSPGRATEAIDVAVPRGRYYVAVHAHDPAPTPGRVQLFAARHELEHTTARGSLVAPATTESVIVVGASENESLESYSSRSASGSVDVSAPGNADTSVDGTFSGTSAAAPYVAGTAALMESSGARDLSPNSVESILERTSDGDRVDALAAVTEASDADWPPSAPATPAVAVGSEGDDARADDERQGDAATDRRNRSTRGATRGNATRSDPAGSTGSTSSTDAGGSQDARDGRDRRSGGGGGSAGDDDGRTGDERTAGEEGDRRANGGERTHTPSQ